MLPNGDIYPDADALLETLLTVKAEQGDLKQQCALGAFYSHRPQRDPQKEKAKQWLRTAADGQSGDALFLLGKMALASAESHVTLEKTESPKKREPFPFGTYPKRHSIFDTPAVEAEVDAEVKADEATSVEDAAIYARQYFSQAAQLGHTEGRIHYIRTLIEGVGGDKALDQAEAEIDALVTAQKEDGSISLLSTIGELYIELGDVEKACAWFEGLMPHELDVIKFEYAHFLLTHKHDEVTYQQVFTWLNEWVLDWDLGALELLGQMYEKGLGRPRDKSTASMYYQLAAHYYYPDAIQSERRIASVMSQADKQTTADMLEVYRTKHPITPEQQEVLDCSSASHLLAREGVTQAETEECIRIFTKYLKEGFGVGLDELIDILYKQKRDKECALWLDVRRLLCVKSMSFFAPCYQKSQQWREIFSRLDNEEIKAIHSRSKRIAKNVDKNLMGRFNNLFFDALEQADKDKEQNKEVNE